MGGSHFDRRSTTRIEEAAMHRHTTEEPAGGASGSEVIRDFLLQCLAQLAPPVAKPINVTPSQHGRKPKPWFRKGRGWYAQIGHKQYPLFKGPNTPEAEAAAKEVLRNLIETSSKVRSLTEQRGTIAERVEAFLSHRAARVAPKSLKDYAACLKTQFAPRFPGRAVKSLTADEIEDWARRPDWSNSTAHGRIGIVNTFLRWAGHPLKLQRPPMGSRGADAALTDEQFEQVIAAYRQRLGGDLPALLHVLRLTGARPSEVMGLTVESVDWSNTCARLKEHKNARRGKTRTIYFPAQAMSILEAQRDVHGNGRLFRTWHGNPYTPESLGEQMRRISKRVGFKVTAYSMRHTFATNALAKGVPEAIAAELLGHTGTLMLSKHYGHLSQQSRALREAAERATAPE